MGLFLCKDKPVLETGFTEILKAFTQLNIVPNKVSIYVLSTRQYGPALLDPSCGNSTPSRNPSPALPLYCNNFSIEHLMSKLHEILTTKF